MSSGCASVGRDSAGHAGKVSEPFSCRRALSSWRWRKHLCQQRWAWTRPATTVSIRIASRFHIVRTIPTRRSSRASNSALAVRVDRDSVLRARARFSSGGPAWVARWMNAAALAVRGEQQASKPPQGGPGFGPGGPARAADWRGADLDPFAGSDDPTSAAHKLLALRHCGRAT